jgi:hypothetical protein
MLVIYLFLVNMYVSSRHLDSPADQKLKLYSLLFSDNSKSNYLLYDVIL